MHATILLFGGPSRERLVSVASAQNVARHLPKNSFRCWFWSPEAWVSEIKLEDLLRHKNAFTTPLLASSIQSWPSIEAALDDAAEQKSLIFNALHGLQGEDGFVQSLCEQREIPLTGSLAAAARVSFDKEKTRQVVAQHGVKIAPALSIQSDELAWPELLNFLEQQKKIVIKPACDGSSFGLAIISDQAQLNNWRESIVNLPAICYLVEKFIAGVELTVGVIDTPEGVRSLPVVEIAAENDRIFDYAGKYLGQGVREVIPARISPEIEQRARAVAAKVHQAVGLRGYSRTDLIATPNDELYFLEVNSLPGLTAQSLVPQELAAVGISLADFLQQQLQLARNLAPVHKFANLASY